MAKCPSKPQPWSETHEHRLWLCSGESKSFGISLLSISQKNLGTRSHDNVVAEVRVAFGYKRCTHDINLIRSYDAVAIKNLLIVNSFD